MTQVFDGHNDALSRLWCDRSVDPLRGFADGRGHVTVEKARAGNLGGGFFALYAPAKRQPFDFSIFGLGMQAIPLPPELDEGVALRAIMAQLGLALQLAAVGHLRLEVTGSALREAMAGDPLAGLLHLEGADAIDADLLALDALFAAGLRSIGPVWSRPTIFGAGVPFAFDQDADTGPGLTEAGHRLVARCQELGMILDTSHITMKGFWDIAEAGVPLVATHSNAYEICPVTRNLTDAQLRAIGETKGMVGLNFGTLFLSEAGWNTGQARIEDMLRHIDHMIAVAGEDHVGLGSDFDGAPLPQRLTSAADLPHLVQAMQAHGYGAALIEKICKNNWLAFLERELG